MYASLRTLAPNFKMVPNKVLGVKTTKMQVRENPEVVKSLNTLIG